MREHHATLEELQRLCDQLGWCIAIPKLRDKKLPGFIIGTEEFCEAGVRRLGWSVFEHLRAPGPTAVAALVKDV